MTAGSKTGLQAGVGKRPTRLQAGCELVPRRAAKQRYCTVSATCMPCW